MSNVVAVAELAMLSSPAGQSAGVQPTAQQVARFEQQLQAPGTSEAQYYQSSVSDSAAGSGNWRGVMSDVGKIAEEYRTEFAEADSGAEASALAPGENNTPARNVEIFTEMMSKVSHTSFTMMNINLLASSERLAGENVRSLYQLE